MPRTARIFSESGYLHVITRGIGRQILFEDRKDYQFYLSIIRKYSEETKVRIIAYCLMENHVHLLIYDKTRNISLMMKKLGVTYAAYYNRKYERTGHLFQDRYLCENIDSERALLIVFRYILNNPWKAGICQAYQYEWSSYWAYGKESSFVDTSCLEELIGGFPEYMQFVAAGVDDPDVCMEYLPRKRDDSWAIAMIQKTLHIESGSALQQFDRQARNDAIRKLKGLGISVRKIERLTGISRNIIQRV